jgi:hypothetical protein
VIVNHVDRDGAGEAIMAVGQLLERLREFDLDDPVTIGDWQDPATTVERDDMGNVWIQSKGKDT